MGTDVVELVRDRTRLRIAPAIGGAIIDWTRRGTSLLRPATEAALAEGNVRLLGCFPLIPYSNRIAGGRFRLGDREYRADSNLAGRAQAIHGVGWQREWRLAHADASSVRLELDYVPDRARAWPFRFAAELEYGLTGEDSLRIAISVENRERRPVPIGAGLHPYFPRTPDARLQFRAEAVWTTDAETIPDARVPIPPAWRFDGLAALDDDLLIDNCFAGWSGSARLAWTEREVAISIRAGEPFRHLIVYSPRGGAFLAVEPVSHMPDAINRMDIVPDHGLRMIEAGERLSGTIEFAAESLAKDLPR
jgi:aldose 1-epimerase